MYRQRLWWKDLHPKCLKLFFFNCSITFFSCDTESDTNILILTFWRLSLYNTPCTSTHMIFFPSQTSFHLICVWVIKCNLEGFVQLYFVWILSMERRMSPDSGQQDHISLGEGWRHPSVSLPLAQAFKPGS